MRDWIVWERLWLAIGDVFLPWKGIKEVLGQGAALAAWVGAAWVTAVAASPRDDLLPSSWSGRLFLAGLALLVIGLGVSAAYRLRTRIDDMGSSSRTERDGQRQRIAIAIHRLVAAHTRLSRDLPRGTHLQAHSSLQEIKLALEAYSEASIKADPLESAMHINIQSVIGSALNETGPELFERLEPVVPILMSYGQRFQIRPNFDEDELEALSGWFEDWKNGGSLTARKDKEVSTPEPDH